MKRKFFYIIIAALTLVCNRVIADNLYADEWFHLYHGSWKDLPIYLEQDKEIYTGFQFDIKISEDITIVEEACRLSEDLADFMSCSFSFLGNGIYRVMAYSPTLTTIKGTSKALVSVRIKGLELVDWGQQGESLYLHNIILTDANGNVKKLQNKKIELLLNQSIPEVTVYDCTRGYGDENGDFCGYDYSWGLEGKPELQCKATVTSPVGTYPITAGIGSLSADLIEVHEGTLTVYQAPLTITAKDYTITQGDALPTFEAEYSGFKNNETADVLINKPVLTTSVTSSSEPGTFDIVASGAEAQNYGISYVKGTLTINPGVYKLTYIIDGEVYKSYDIEYGATITPETDPTKEGHTFSGWSEIPEAMPAHDVTVTGTFSINKYKLTYIVDGEMYKSYDIEYGATITPEAEPTKEGYIFSGWSEIPETMPAHDVTVTGSFSKGQYKLIYMVDGQTYKTISYDYGDIITPEPAPVRDGYTFSGWSEIPATMPAHDVTVIGTFAVNKYKLTYVVDGIEYKSYDIEFGAAITPETTPTKVGYTFSGWSEIPATMPAHDVTVTGTFSINKYKLTYIVDGVEYKSYDIEFGAAITPEVEPTKEGYSFSGWSEIPATMPAHDVTVTGTFSINKYKLTYIVDGEVYKSYDIEYGATITPETEPTKEGYIFSGWSEIPETMPAHDVTVEGTFTLDTTGIVEISVSNPADVYILQGQKVRSQATTLKGLPSGIYIVNGRKIFVK